MIQWRLEPRPLIADDMVLTLDKLKSHLWTVGIDADDDYITDLCLSAMQYLEQELNTSLVSRYYKLIIDQFPFFWVSLQQMVPGMIGIVVPVWPLVSVESIEYVDFLTGPQSYDLTGLQIRNFQPPSIFTKAGNVWPFSSPQQVASVEIELTAGYASGEVPQAMLQAIRFLVSHWYKNREPAQQALLQPMPLGIAAMIRNQKWWY